MKEQKGHKLWGTDSESVSGGQEVLYGTQVLKSIIDGYRKNKLNEEPYPVSEF